jgi:methylenetetrahydrofolate dehydrogenase (NADP+)/methenyltetrahydrofolate cyclohydrolase
MQTIIIDGKKIRDEILEEVKKGVAQLSFQPVFCDVLVGSDPVSAQYVKMKGRTAESVGIHFHNAHFPIDITTDQLIDEVHKLKDIPNMCGLIVQLPLPAHIDKQKILDSIDQSIDVDCLGQDASIVFYNSSIEIGYPTALSCMRILDSLNINLEDKNIVVVGQGQLVGMPVAHLLKIRNLEVGIVTRETDNKDEIIKNADVIISGTGAGKLLTGEKIKEGAILIDAGTSESNGSIVGDVDLDSVQGIASFVSPVPGGVGPVTVGILLQNVLKVAQKKNNE